MIDWRAHSDEWLVDFITKTQSDMESDRRIMQPMYDSAIRLFQPRRYDLDRIIAEPARQGSVYGIEVFDAHPARTLAMFATSMTGNMISRGEEDPWWLKFVAPDQRLMDVDDVKMSLQFAEDQVRFGYNQSTFYEQVPQLMADAAVCYGVMTAKRSRNGDHVAFQTRHPGSYWFKVDDENRVKAHHFKLRLSALDLFEMYGENPRFPDSIKQEVMGDKPTPWKRYDIIHAIYDNHSRRLGSVQTSDKPFIQFTLVEAVSKGKKARMLVDISGQDWAPICLRLGSSAEQPYPLSMALDALTSATYTNAIMRDQLMISAHGANPARLIHQNLRQQVQDNRVNPGSNTYYKDPKEKIEYLTEMGRAVMNSELGLEKMARWTDEAFHIPYFQMLSGTPDAPQRTAFEVSQMVAEKIPLVSPVIEASEGQVLEPSSGIIWAYETQAGRLTGLADELFQGSSRQVQNQYMGRFAKLRRTLRDAQGSVAVLQVMGELAQLFPSALRRIKMDKFTEDTLISHGAKQDIFYTDAEFEAIEERNQAAVQRQEQLALAGEAMKALPPGKAVEPNSPAALAASAA